MKYPQPDSRGRSVDVENGNSTAAKKAAVGGHLNSMAMVAIGFSSNGTLRLYI